MNGRNFNNFVNSKDIKPHEYFCDIRCVFLINIRSVYWRKFSFGRFKVNVAISKDTLSVAKQRESEKAKKKQILQHIAVPTFLKGSVTPFGLND